MTTAPRTRHRAPPAVRVTVAHPGSDPLELELTYPLDPQLDELLWALHRSGVDQGVIECRMHDDDPALRDLREEDGRIHGAWLYLRQIDDISRPGHKRLVLCHWPRGIVRGSHDVPSLMTPEHRRRQEYVALRGQACGYDVLFERKLDNGFQPDVLIKGGTAALSAEIQMSDISVASVIRRTGKAAEAGATSVWFPGGKNPAWAFKAPHVETNERPGFDPRTWTVTTGPRMLEHERCTAGSRLGSCPNGRNWCHGWHWLWTPIAGLAVDDIVEQVPAGALVRLDTGTKQGVILARPADQRAWADEQATRSARQDRRRLPDMAGHLRHHPQQTAALRERIQKEQTHVAVPRQRAHVDAGRCVSCGEFPRGYNSDVCTRCFFFPGRFTRPGAS